MFAKRQTAYPLLLGCSVVPFDHLGIVLLDALANQVKRIPAEQLQP